MISQHTPRIMVGTLFLQELSTDRSYIQDKEVPTVASRHSAVQYYSQSVEASKKIAERTNRESIFSLRMGEVRDDKQKVRECFYSKRFLYF